MLMQHVGVLFGGQQVPDLTQTIAARRRRPLLVCQMHVPIPLQLGFGPRRVRRPPAYTSRLTIQKLENPNVNNYA